jgi:Ser/Thr protein kinase RdoA (MazF antagonist)
VAELIQHHQDYEFLSNYTYDGGLESILLDIANRLQIHYRKIKFVLPYQLIHGDAHFDNLVFDGTTIGIFDFDNLGFAPRIYELAAPLNHLYELELWHKKITNSKRLALLTKALLDGYMEQVKLSNWELASLPLLQAIHLFGVLGWTIKQQDSSKCQLWLRENFAVGLEQILIFLDIYEKSFILSKFKILQQISWENQKNLLRFYTLKIWQRSKKILKILAVKN